MLSLEEPGEAISGTVSARLGIVINEVNWTEYQRKLKRIQDSDLKADEIGARIQLR